MADKVLLKNNPMLKYVVEEYQRFERFHQDRFELAAKIYDQWCNVPEKRGESWQNAVHVPITFASEQTITPRLFSALFPTASPIEAEGYEIPEDTRIKIRDLIKHYFRVADVQGESIPALTQCTLLGTGYLESPWVYERKWQIGREGVRYQALVKNRPGCRVVNFFELFPHPAKLRMDDGLPIIRRRFCDAEYLKNLAENPHFKFQNLKEALDSEPTTYLKSPIVGNDNRPLETKKREEYELLEYWGPWDVSYKKDNQVVSQKAVPHWIIIVNRAVMIRGIMNPFNHQMPPFVKFTLFPDVKPCWFGVGMGSVGKPTQDRLNKIVNQRLDNVDLVLNKQGFYNGNDILINTKKLQVSKPGQWHKVSDTVNSIRWMDTPDVTASSYKEEELAKADYREATGATVPLMPTDEGQHRTAAGINLLQGAAGIRFRPILRKIETDLIQELALIFLSNLQQFMVLPEWIKVVTDDGREAPVLVKPEEIQARVKFIPTGMSETVNKEIQVSQLLRFKEVSIQDPTINRAEINRRIGELMGLKNLKDLIVKQSPLMVTPEGLSPQTQQLIQQRIAEGASPEQVKAELLGGMAGGGGGRVRGEQPNSVPRQPATSPRTPSNA
jgi:hypothetical protein